MLQTVAEMEEVSKRVFPDWYEPKPLVLPPIIPAFKSKPECIGFSAVRLFHGPVLPKKQSQEAQVQVPSTNADLMKLVK